MRVPIGALPLRPVGGGAEDRRAQQENSTNTKPRTPRSSFRKPRRSSTYNALAGHSPKRVGLIPSEALPRFSVSFA